MQRTALPDDARAFTAGGWDVIAPHYDELRERPLDEPSAWLADWSRLEDLVKEAHALSTIDYTTDTADPEKERVHLRWVSEIDPLLAERRDGLARRLVDSGYQAPGLEQVLRRLRNEIELYREENLALDAEDGKLRTAYRKTTGSMAVDWDGEQRTVPQVESLLASSDRAVRERAYRLHLHPYVEARDELATLFDGLLDLRQRIARNAGFTSYRDFRHAQLNRFEYSPDDCLRWHEAVEEVAVPAAARAMERRRRRLGVETLRPWDMEPAPDPGASSGARPFEDGGELLAGVGRIFERIDPVLAERYRTLVSERLIDVGSRHGKAPGGYCVTLPHRSRTFIFMNAAGADRDVTTLLHESGHAFHAFEAADLPLHWQRNDYGAEIAEVASMSMELLAMPYLGRAEGGFYDEEALRRVRGDDMERTLVRLCHIASVDAFQHWLYTDPAGADRDARDAQWLRLRERFQQRVDFSGLSELRVARWYKQLHPFLFPFYYIEYGLAQLGALQVWRASRRDRAGALRAYRAALALGGTRPLPELYAAAGARLVFDAKGMRELVEMVEEEMVRP